MVDEPQNETPATESPSKTPEQVRADAVAAGIEQTKKDNPGWSGEGPWPVQ